MYIEPSINSPLAFFEYLIQTDNYLAFIYSFHLNHTDKIPTPRFDKETLTYFVWISDERGYNEEPYTYKRYLEYEIHTHIYQSTKLLTERINSANSIEEKRQIGVLFSEVISSLSKKLDSSTIEDDIQNILRKALISFENLTKSKTFIQNSENNESQIPKKEFKNLFRDLNEEGQFVYAKDENKLALLFSNENLNTEVDDIQLLCSNRDFRIFIDVLRHYGVNNFKYIDLEKLKFFKKKPNSKHKGIPVFITAQDIQNSKVQKNSKLEIELKKVCAKYKQKL